MMVTLDTVAWKFDYCGNTLLSTLAAQINVDNEK